MRDIEKHDGGYLEQNNIRFNASFIVGGQIRGEPIRLFRIYAEAISSKPGSTRPSSRPVKPSTGSRFSTA
jgi:putative proteasome-type protease